MRNVLSLSVARAAIGRVRVCVVTRVAAVRVPIAAAACQCDEDWHPDSPVRAAEDRINPFGHNISLEAHVMVIIHQDPQFFFRVAASQDRIPLLCVSAILCSNEPGIQSAGIRQWLLRPVEIKGICVLSCDDLTL
ncbi:unnamed protein product [Natator depressus]